MLVIDDYKIAYLHINKTAGTSIKKYLIDITHPAHSIQMGPTHGPLEQNVRLMGRRFYDYNILTSVRNPYARLLSIYLFRRRRYKNGEQTAAMQAANDLTFKRWFKEVISNSSRLTDLSISRSVLIDGELPKNVSIITVESLNKDMARFVSGIVGVDTYNKLPFLNKTNLIKGHHKKYYDEEMVDLVHKWDQWTIDNYYPWSVDKYF